MKFTTLLDLLQHRAACQPEKTAYTFLDDSGKQNATITYFELEQKVLAIAAGLQAEGLYGERALLLYHPGIDYIAAFLGCLYAGVIPVPAYPPESRNLGRLQRILANAEPAICLSATAIIGAMPHFDAQPQQSPFYGSRELPEDNPAAGLYALRWYATDQVETASGKDWRQPNLKPGSLAFLQYTSGSTSQPKGVMVTHANLLDNSRQINDYFDIGAENHIVSWLPPYHDMGLIGGILQPLYAGATGTMMSPFSFMKRPVNWLRAITECRDKGEVVSGAPDFAYSLCADKVRDEQLPELDLHHWRVAFSGAEPVRPATLEKFRNRFAPCGFDGKAFYPVYGLAEVTLLATAGPVATEPVVKLFDEAQLKKHQVSELHVHYIHNTRQYVGCGGNLPGQELLIVDPDTCRPCPPDEIGEIWVAGPSVAAGYWRNPEATTHAFQAYATGTDGSRLGPYFRTGDLGFMVEGNLFVTGRQKDLIIIRGRNHYPQDIELTVAGADPALRPDCGVAFSIEHQGEEQLVIVQEVKREFLRKIDPGLIFNAAITAISQTHQLQVASMVLVEPSTIPKTTSGKLQRSYCKKQYLEGELKKIDAYSLMKIPAGW